MAKMTGKERARIVERLPDPCDRLVPLLLADNQSRCRLLNRPEIDVEDREIGDYLTLSVGA